MKKQTTTPFFATLKEAKANCKSYYEDNGQLRGCTCGTCPTPPPVKRCPCRYEGEDKCCHEDCKICNTPTQETELCKCKNTEGAKFIDENNEYDCIRCIKCKKPKSQETEWKKSPIYRNHIKYHEIVAKTPMLFCTMCLELKSLLTQREEASVKKAYSIFLETIKNSKNKFPNSKEFELVVDVRDIEKALNQLQGGGK